MTLAHATVADLLEQTAARTPSPGGGTAAGLAGAAAAALTEMAAAFALSRSPTEDQRTADLHARAGFLRARLLELADADRHAYEPVLEALGLPRSNPGRAAALRAALSAAAEVPLEIVVAATEVAELAATIAQVPGNQSLLGDASAALIIAEAAAASAAGLIELNLATAREDPRLQRALVLARRAAELRGGAGL